LVINTHRHFSAGLLTAFSGAKQKIGFSQNPWSWTFHKKVKHSWDLHETQRNHLLIAELTDAEAAKPRLYPSSQDQKVKELYPKPYISISAASLWATKQLPLEIWAQFMDALPKELEVLLMGGPADQEICTKLAKLSQHKNTRVIAGQHNFLEDVVIMQHAKMNYVLDSAPLHICSASNAPVTAVFCSTSPSFGFGPLSDISYIVETKNALDCRPCGAHGHKKCPKGHFQCSGIQIQQLLNSLP
jgi:heptosyltransferase-2